MLRVLLSPLFVCLLVLRKAQDILPFSWYLFWPKFLPVIDVATYRSAITIQVETYRRQGGRVVIGADLGPGGPGFKFPLSQVAGFV